MATTALGIAPDPDGNGVDPLTLRRIIARRYENAGIVDGLTVSGRSDLTYAVSEGLAVCSRSGSDGFTEAYVEGGTTPAVTAGDPSNPRIDSVYVVARDLSQGDADNRVAVGVKQGTPSASPVAPVVSTVPGALRLLDWWMPAGAASTGAGHAYSNAVYALPHGASQGVVHTWTDTYNAIAFQGSLTLGAVTKEFSTDRNLTLEIAPCISVDGLGEHSGVCGYSFLVDGVVIASSELAYTDAWETKTWRFPTDVTAGSHTFAFERHKRAGGNFWQHYGMANGMFFPGTIFRVIDEGIHQ